MSAPVAEIAVLRSRVRYCDAFDMEAEKDFPERVSAVRDSQDQQPLGRRRRPCDDVDKARHPFQDHTISELVIRGA
jgi:hypothetical protein